MSCLHIFYKNDNEYEYEMDSFSYSLSMLTLSNNAQNEYKFLTVFVLHKTSLTGFSEM